MNNESIFILLFVVATTVAIGVRWLHVPYTVALVLTGLVLGWLRLFPAPELTRELLFSVFLPGLIFEAAFHIDFDDAWRNRATLVSLAVPGVVASIALTVAILTPVAGLLPVVHDFGWRQALVFGALISATDPIAVIAIFRSLGVPPRLSMLLDGESLLNDGTGIVFFGLSLALFTGASVTVAGLAVQFVKVVGLGAAIGAAVGVTAAILIRQIDDAMIEITLTTIAAYGSFVIAEQLHYSGVIATVTAGMLCGNYGARTGMSPSTRMAAETFWEYVAFALNSIVFLLIGLEVHLSVLFSVWPAILVAYAVVTVGRGLVIQLNWGLMRFTRERFPWRWSMVLTWGGLRGALPMVLVLSLPADFPNRGLLVAITFGVVILSILVHGLTMSPLLRRLGVVQAPARRGAYELRRARLQAADAAMAELDRMIGRQLVAPQVAESLRQEYRQSIDRTRAEIGALDMDPQQLRGEELLRARRRLLLTERAHAIEAYRQGAFDREIYQRLLADVDARLLQLESGQEDAGADGNDEAG